jgi:hypothetical protein
VCCLPEKHYVKTTSPQMPAHADVDEMGCRNTGGGDPWSLSWSRGVVFDV